MVTKALKFDDLSGDGDAVEMAFAVDGKSWVIDLCPKNRAEFDRFLKRYIDAATPIGSPAVVRKPKTTADGPAAADVRAWATANGVNVSTTGRVNREAIDAYLAATGPQRASAADPEARAAAAGG